MGQGGPGGQHQGEVRVGLGLTFHNVRWANGSVPGGVSPNGSIQNVLGRLLISQDFLPRSVTTGRFRDTLRNKGFSRASVTTGRNVTLCEFGQAGTVSRICREV